MTMSDCDAGISLLTSAIPPFTFYTWTCHYIGAPCERPGWIKVSLWLYATLWTGRRAEDLNPCLEQSRSRAAGKPSSVQSSASPHFPSHTERSAHVMVDIIALSSIYLFPPLPSELEVTKWNEVTREQSTNAYCQRAQRFLSHVQKQMSDWLHSDKILLVYLPVLFFHPHTSGSLVQVNWVFFIFVALQEAADAACWLNMLFSLCLTGLISLKIMFQFCKLTPRTVPSQCQNVSYGRIVLLPNTASCPDFPPLFCRYYG